MLCAAEVEAREPVADAIEEHTGRGWGLQLAAPRWRRPRETSRVPARVSGGGGEHGDPHLGGSAAVGLAGFAAQPSGVLEHGECALDLAALLVAAEQFGDLGAGEAGGAFLGGRPELVGGRIAERVAEDPAAEAAL